MAVVDIIQARGGTFIVDTAQKEVAITPDPGIYVSDPNNLTGQLEPADNCIVQSAWGCLPYCFGMGATPLLMKITGQERGGSAFDIPQLGSTDFIWEPTENVEVEINEYIPWTVAPTPLPWYFIGEASGTISMANVPASFQGDELPIWIYLKILHNLPLEDVT